VGVFIAVPLTVLVVLACAHVPALQPLALLLARDGDADVLVEWTHTGESQG